MLYVIVMYYVMEIEQRLFNRLGTTTMYLLGLVCYSYKALLYQS